MIHFTTDGHLGYISFLVSYFVFHFFAVDNVVRRSFLACIYVLYICRIDF